MGGRLTETGDDLRTLLTVGSIGALDDGELLDLFEGRGEGASAADRAFETLVERYGGMVLRVARGRLDSEEDARDAFQATFWLLARRSRSIRNREALAGWLFGVASRVAARAGVEATRRRDRERRAATPVEDSTLDPARPDRDLDLAPTIQDEVRRLPEKYRAAVILRDLEGLSSEEAATRLGCPVGTLKARLSRARARLRTRLADRGFAPLGWESSPPRPLVVPIPLIRAACRVALSASPSAGPPAATVASIITLARGASRTMFLSSIQSWTAVAAIAVAATVGGAIITENFPSSGSGQNPIGTSEAGGPGSTRPETHPTSRPSAPVETTAPTVFPLPLHPQVFRQAIIAAEALPDAPSRTEALLRIGRSQTLQGDRDGARQTLRKALAVMATGKPEESWTTYHPVARIAEAQALNGDAADAHQTFGRSIAVIEALSFSRQPNEFRSAIKIQQKIEGRHASRDLVTAYRSCLTKLEVDRGTEQPSIMIARLASLAGDFDGALDTIRRSREFQGPGCASFQVKAYLAVAGSLLPDDPPTLIDSILTRTRQAIFEEEEVLSGFNNAIPLIKIALNLGRFEQAEELGTAFGKPRPPDVLDRRNEVKVFNISMCYNRIAEAENNAGQFERAKKSAMKAIEWIRGVDEPKFQHHPINRALDELLKAGGEEGAKAILESLPPGLPQGRFSEVFASYFEQKGKEAEARRWREIDLNQTRRDLDQALAARPKVEMQVASLKGRIARLELSDLDVPQALRAIEAMPVADRPRTAKDLAGDWAKRGRVAEALTLAEQITDPESRRDIEIVVATSLPIPPANQSPRSDAAR